MGRLGRLTSIAYSNAERSELKIKHGSVLSKGSKPIFNGMNTSRTKSLKKIYFCEHAEVNVVRQFINRMSRKKGKKWTKRNIGKFIVWVVRINSKCENSDHFKVTESKPCQNCIDELKQIGIKRIGYSNIDGNIIVKKIDTLTGILSGAQMSYKRQFNSVYHWSQSRSFHNIL
jgi:deoxycytidylate deaminase